MNVPMLWHFSAAGKSEDAYELANGKISKCADAIESDIESIKKIVNQDANAQRQKLTSAYHSSIGTSIVTILISIAALFFSNGGSASVGNLSACKYEQGNE